MTQNYSPSLAPANGCEENAPQLFMRRPLSLELPALPKLPEGYHLGSLEAHAWAGVANLLKVAFEDDEWTAERVQHEFVEAPAVMTTWVIAYQGHVVATASSQVCQNPHPNSAYLHFVAGHPAHSGLGLGRIVTLAVLHEFARLGYAEVFLLTDDFRLAAIKTYLKLGFLPEFCDRTHPARWEAVRSNIG